MKKKIYLLLSLLSSSFLGFSQTLADRTPNDALMVFNFNFESIHSKINLQKIKNLEMIEFAFANIKESLGKDSTIVKKMYADPNTYGINLKPSLSLILRERDNEYGEKIMTKLLIVNLSNMKKFEKLMKSVFNEGTEYKDFLETKGAYKVFQSNDIAFVWNINTLYITPIDYNNRETIEAELTSLTSLNKTNSLVSNPNFLEKNSTSKDINFWMDYEKFLEVAQEKTVGNAKSLFDFDLEKLKGSETEMGMLFENGKITFESLSITNELLKKESAAIYSQKVNPEFFNYLQQDSLLGVFSMAFNVNEMKKSIESNYKNLLDTIEIKLKEEGLKKLVVTNKKVVELQKKLDSDTLEWENRWVVQDSLDQAIDSLVKIEMKTVDNKIDNTLKDYGVTKAEAWELFKGDFLLAATGVYNVIDTVSSMEYTENLDGEMVYQEIEKTQLSPRPLFLSVATINLTDKCANILKKLESEGYIKKKDDYYFITVTQYDFFIKLNGNVLIFTNDKSVVTKKAKSGTNIYGKSLDANILKKSSENPIYFFADIQKMLLKIPTAENEKKMLEPALSTFENFETVSTLKEDKNTVSSAVLNLKTEENSIHILLNLANEYYKLFAIRE